MHMWTLATYLERVTGRDRALTLAELREAIGHVAPLPDELAPYVRFNDRQYARNPIRVAPHCEVLLLCWKNGQRTPIHDHGGSIGAVRVVTGVLTISQFVPAPNGMIRPTGSMDLGPGAIDVVDAAGIHQFANLQADRKELVTLHTYVPPVPRMRLYSLHDPVVRTVSADVFYGGAGI